MFFVTFSALKQILKQSKLKSGLAEDWSISSESPKLSSPDFRSPSLTFRISQDATVWHLNPVNLRMKACLQHPAAAWSCLPTDLPGGDNPSAHWSNTSAPNVDFSLVKTNIFPKTPRNESVNSFTPFFHHSMSQLSGHNFNHEEWDWDSVTHQDFMFQDHSLHLNPATALSFHQSISESELNHINSMLKKKTRESACSAGGRNLHRNWAPQGSVSALHYSGLSVHAVGRKVNLVAMDQCSVVALLAFSLPGGAKPEY